MSTDENSPTISSELPSSNAISSSKQERGSKRTVVFDVRTLEASLDDVADAWTVEAPQVPRISFVSYDLMHKLLAPNRMAILRVMLGAGPLSIREIARRVDRDFKGVHSDVAALRGSGVLRKGEDGKVVFPYDEIRFDFWVNGQTK